MKDILIADTRKEFLRPLWLSMATTVSGELSIFLIWGAFLYPDGNLLHKFLWAVVFCGIGMGATIGSLISLFVVQRFEGIKAILITMALSGGVLGIGCNLLCFNLDQHFNYFGANDTPVLFLGNGLIMSLIGGGIIGWFLFTDKGQQKLERFGV